MRKLLGTVSVFVDESVKDQPSCCKPTGIVPTDEWPRDFNIELHPSCDSDVMKGLDNLTSREKLQTLLCHELGHFVGIITQDKRQHPIYQAIEGQLPSEKQAWELGAQMAPCDPTIKRRCLASYERAEEEIQQDAFLMQMRQWAKKLAGKLPKTHPHAFLNESHVIRSVALAPWRGMQWYIRTMLTLTSLGFALRLAPLVTCFVLGVACNAHAHPIGDAVLDQMPTPIGNPVDMASLFAGIGVVGSFAIGRVLDRKASAKPQPKPSTPDYSLDSWENEGGAL
jgi:hypothetical protein